MNGNTIQTEVNTSFEAGSSPPNPKRRSWVWYTFGGMILVAVVLTGVIFLPGYDTPKDDTEADPINFAEVVITDLIQEETIQRRDRALLRMILSKPAGRHHHGTPCSR